MPGIKCSECCSRHVDKQWGLGELCLKNGKLPQISKFEHQASTLSLAVTQFEYFHAKFSTHEISGLDLTPDSMRIRRQTVEHPYGTIKLWMGSAHFLMRTLKHVSTEMSLHVLAYNLKRVIKILGIKGLMEAIKAWAGLFDDQTNTIVAVS